PGQPVVVAIQLMRAGRRAQHREDFVVGEQRGGPLVQLCQVAAESGYRSTLLPFLNQTAFNHPYIVQALRRLHCESEQREPTLSQEVQLRELLELTLANFSEIRLSSHAVLDEKTPITQAKNYMQAYYAKDIQLDDLAQVAHLSKSYFIRAFRHHEGLSPYAYVVQVRLNRAKTLLENGISSTVIAHETGFFDQSHFTRAFKRFLGITPARYQQAIG
ncbi:MAG: AraC family transcriptional regulator, partial [Chloroflexota bacterium]